MFEPCRTWAAACVSAISGMGNISRNDGEGGCRQRRHTLGRAGCGQRESPHHDPSRELDLEAVVAGGLRLSERRLGSTTEKRGIRPAAGEDLFGSTGAPGF